MTSLVHVLKKRPMKPTAFFTRKRANFLLVRCQLVHNFHSHHHWTHFYETGGEKYLDNFAYDRCTVFRLLVDWPTYVMRLFLFTLDKSDSVDLDIHENWGLDVVLMLQKYRTATVTSGLKVLSLFGYEVFVPFLMLFVWAGGRRDQQFSMGFALILTECYWLQSVLKLVYARNRPYDIVVCLFVCWLVCFGGCVDETYFLLSCSVILSLSADPSLDLASSSTTVSELYSYPSGHSFASTVAWFTVANHMDIPTWYEWSRDVSLLLWNWN
jgi:hypothetical protein